MLLERTQYIVGKYPGSRYEKHYIYPNPHQSLYNYGANCITTMNAVDSTGKNASYLLSLRVCFWNRSIERLQKHSNPVLLAILK